MSLYFIVQFRQVLSSSPEAADDAGDHWERRPSLPVSQVSPSASPSSLTVSRLVLIYPSLPVRLMWERVEVQLENLLKNVFVSLVLSGSDVPYPLLNSVIPSNVRSTKKLYETFKLTIKGRQRKYKKGFNIYFQQ